MVKSMLKFALFLLLFIVFFGLVPPGVVHVQAQQVAAAEKSPASERAAMFFREGRMRLVDTRTPYERGGRSIADALAIPFGPEAWDDGVGDFDRYTFLAGIKAAGLTSNDWIVTVCNSGIRASAAAEFLRSVGYLKVQSVTGGYIGNFDPARDF